VAGDGITLVDVERQSLPGGDVWLVWLDTPAGRLPHVVPLDILEWRSAEYGIDDPDELIDIVLAEPWIRDGHDHTHPRSLHNADSIDDARNWHRERVADVKARHRFTGPAAVRQRIRNESPMHPEAIAIKQEWVGEIRRQARAGRQAATPPGDRVEELRRRLRPDRDGRGDSG